MRQSANTCSILGVQAGVLMIYLTCWKNTKRSEHLCPLKQHLFSLDYFIDEEKTLLKHTNTKPSSKFYQPFKSHKGAAAYPSCHRAAGGTLMSWTCLVCQYDPHPKLQLTEFWDYTHKNIKFSSSSTYVPLQTFPISYHLCPIDS